MVGSLKKQRCVTKASTYTENVAPSEAMSELMSIREIMKIFNVNLDDNPVKIDEDNSGVMSIAKHGILQKILNTLKFITTMFTSA